LSSYNDEDVVYAVLELNYWTRDWYTFDDLENAIDDIERWKITYYSDMDSYYDSCDDCLCFTDPNSVEARYFDYEAFHRDCEYDVSEASNWIVIANW
jgi:hypothetical protein